MPRYFARCCLLLLLSALLMPPRVLAASVVVGSGSPASCTEAAFDAALSTLVTSGGGSINFNCGAAPHTILFSGVKQIAANVELRGGNQITLSGGNATSLFQVFVNRSFVVRNITLTRAYGPGGAIENFGRLEVYASQLSNNTSSGDGGAILNYATATFDNVLFSKNTASQSGGGLYSAGDVTITNSQLSDNLASLGGGGAVVAAGSQLELIDTTVSANRTSGTFAEGGGIQSSGTLTVTGSLFSQNHASRGGAISVLAGTTKVVSSTFSTNTAAYGGGIRQLGGALAITNTTLSGNGYNSTGAKVTTSGGAFSQDGGTASLVQVTISDNWASYGGGFDHTSGSTALINVTISGNNAVGGGGFDQGGGTISLTNVTLSNNAAPFFGAAISNRKGILTLTNTALADNLNPDNRQPANCYQPIANHSFSISSDFTCAFGGQRDNLNLRLGPLASNGGAQQTHLPARNSPLIDAGAGASCPATDQRGITRPQGQACDIGAVEATTSELLARAYLPLIRR